MDLPNQLSAIKLLIGEGNAEQALEQLVALLDSDPKYAELTQVARVNQGELYQVKAQMLKNTIAPEDARLAMNQLADNALQIIRRLEAGKLTFEDAEAKPSRSQAWRYYVIGGVATLALAILGWWFFGREEDCPVYGDDAKYRVMILPFKQTGNMTNFEPEFEIVDGLNKLISKTPRLKAGADVNENYNIEKNYPSFAEAVNIANDCSVQMIVWGKIRKDSEIEYKMDVFYKLIGAGGETRGTGDTTLSKLLITKDEGQQLTRDVAAVTNLLYIVLASQARVPVIASLLEDFGPDSSATKSAADTSWMITTLALAENFKNNKQPEKAIEAYDKVLETFPENQEARQKRGALFYQKGEFAAAVRDLEFAAPDAEKATPSLLKIRAEAAIKSGDPAKAMDDLRSLRKTGGEDAWTKEKIQEARDTMNALQKRLNDIEHQAQAKPRDAKAQLEAAKTNAKLGRHDKALNYADRAIKNNPSNEAAYELKVTTQLAKGDTSGAEKTIQAAEKSGVNAKSIDKWRPIINKLDLPLKPRQ